VGRCIDNPRYVSHPSHPLIIPSSLFNTMPTTSTLNHAGLGKLTGLLKDDVVSFRGIKYASLQSRFAASEPTFPAAPAKEDATKFGPEPLQNLGACAVEWFLIGGECPTEPGVEQDWSGLEGLTLNITTPKNIPAEKKLPVLIFIHGNLVESQLKQGEADDL
jgi:carboxylesterase type B